MIATYAVNQAFMTADAHVKATKGLLAMTGGALLSGTRVYRFASSMSRERFFCGPWWFGQSPFDTIKAAARQAGRPLRDVARECLAVDFDWNAMDFLVSATVGVRLAAWTGTPLTQSIKTPSLLLPRGEHAGGRYVRQWEPDRTVTQYYVPGLDALVRRDWVPGRTDVLRPGWRPASPGGIEGAQPLWAIAFTHRREQPLSILRL